MKAIWNNKTIAESNETIVVENNHYFPKTALKQEFFKESELTSVCPWKGKANYYTVEVDGSSNEDAAWTYKDTKHGAKQIEGYVAFWKGVEVVE